MSVVTAAIERAIEYIWERYSEPVSLDELSKSALLSRFHFARTFRDVTGVTPGRFLSAVRIYQAKVLLLTTSRTITDISSAVGYQSLGSFTNYFTQSVGMPPSRFRHRVAGAVLDGPPSGHSVCPSRGTAALEVSFPAGCSGLRVYVGIFPSPILQSPPAASKIIDTADGHPLRCVLPNVPPGTWFVHAVAGARAIGLNHCADQPLFVDRRDAVSVGAHRAPRVSMRLRPSRPTDPPILLALPDLRSLQAPRARQVEDGYQTMPSRPSRPSRAMVSGMTLPGSW